MRSVTVSPVRSRTGAAWGTGAVGGAVNGATAGVGGNSPEGGGFSALGGGRTTSTWAGCAVAAGASHKTQAVRAANLREQRTTRSLMLAALFASFMIPLRGGRVP